MSLQNRLREIVVGHCDWLEAKIEEIADSIGSSASHWLNDPDVIRQSYELTHQVTGACGTLGFAEVSEAASALEAHLKDVLDQDPPASDVEWRHALDLFGRLQKVAAGAAPEQSSLYQETFAAEQRRA